MVLKLSNQKTQEQATTIQNDLNTRLHAIALGQTS